MDARTIRKESAPVIRVRREEGPLKHKKIRKLGYEKLLEGLSRYQHTGPRTTPNTPNQQKYRSHIPQHA